MGRATSHPKNVFLAALALSATGAVADRDFNVLQHLGGNGQWFPGEYQGISSDVPSGCVVDQAAFVSRHGSRYPDRGAYNEWANLTARIQQAGSFSTTDKSLAFLASWEPVLTNPDAQIAQISTTGYKELYDMGAAYRFRYPDLYEYGDNFTMWANYYSSSPRVRDSARLFARGYLGPNAGELGSIYALNASDPRSVANSLATSDQCPNYADNGGSPQIDTWQGIYLPPIQKRLNRAIKGGFQFTQSDVSIIPYLCGFETQITGSRSPFCDVFTEKEILQYEYAQDLRYWYGTGLGTDIEKSLMLPVLLGLVERFEDGPNATYTNSDGTTFVPSKLTAAFTNDGQVNQLASAIGVFDGQKALPANNIPKDRLFRSSNYITMKGTISFERLNCGKKGINMRILLNDVVYPVEGCQSGPGKSCPLKKYKEMVEKKLKKAGDFQKICNVTSSVVPIGSEKTTFWKDVKLPFESLVKP